MKVLINVNEQITATMMMKHFQASGLEAEIMEAPNKGMLEVLKANKFDLIAFCAEEVDNAALISLFKATGDIRKILFVKKHNLGLMCMELEEILDECFTIPIDSGDLMIRLRRMIRPAEGEITPYQPLPRQAKLMEQEQPQHERDTPENKLRFGEKVTCTAPRNTNYASSTDDFRQQSAPVFLPPTAPITEQKAAKKRQAAAVIVGPDKGRKKNKKSPLRYLNKAELLEIILDQEKMLNALNNEKEEIRKKLDEREIALDESGSIAEAALKLNGIFEAAQKSADQYVKSVKGNSI